MIDQLVALIVDEGKWLTASLGVALLAVAHLLYGLRHSAVPARRRVLAAMNLYFGILIGAMAFGHLLAVMTKLSSSTLEGPTSVFLLIGLALAVPSSWLIVHTRRAVAAGDKFGRGTLGLNIWLAVTLLALGLHNLPLAAPAFLNIGYQSTSNRALGWAIVALAVVAGLGLFIASVVFLASGQSFEQFRG